MRIPKKDIYFIETIKSTHYCQIYYRQGTAILKADICRLEPELGAEFLKVRSSTLVNVRYIRRIDRKNRILYLDGSRGLTCSYTMKSYRELKERLHIR